MTDDPHDDLVRALRDADDAQDPGQAFFEDQARRIQQRLVDARPPRRSWWARLGPSVRRLRGPALALSGGVAVALLVIWWTARPPASPLRPPARVHPEAQVGKEPTPPVPRPGGSSGAAWLARHAPAQGLRSLPAAALPALLDELRGADALGVLALDDGLDGGADDLEPTDEPVTEQILESLDEAALSRVYRRLLRELPRATNPARAPMRRPG